VDTAVLDPWRAGKSMSVASGAAGQMTFPAWASIAMGGVVGQADPGERTYLSS